MALPEPSFVDRDPVAVTAAMVAEFEAALGRQLQPAQVERLIVNVMAYRETLLRIAVQEAAKQNLVAYARFPMLDHLGQLVGVTRLPVQPARTTLRFTAPAPAEFPIGIAAGTRVSTVDGKVVFATAAAATIAVGETTVDVEAVATAVGAAFNGFAAGQLVKMVVPIGAIATVSNLTATNGGADEESDDALRERIRLAPNTFSVAGPLKAYIALARNAHQDVVDVAVTSPVPGDIHVYPLTRTGLPSAEIKGLVEAAIDGNNKRPHGDNVSVLDPAAVDYAIDVNVWLLLSADQAAATARAEDALQALADDWAGRLGGHIVPAAIIATVKAVEGVFDVSVATPSETQTLDPEQWPSCSGITVTIAGVVDA